MARLVEHFDPERLELVVGDYANYDGTQLSPLVAKRGGSVSRIAGRRYHHGKLIEWVTGQTRMALTGSPNLSRPALLEAMAEGGNCELGLVGEVASSLRPEVEAALDREQIADHGWNPLVSGDAPQTGPTARRGARGRGAAARSPATPHRTGQTPAPRRYEVGDIRRRSAGIMSPVVSGRARRWKVSVPPFADGTRTASRGVTDLERTNFRHVAAERTITGRPADFTLDPRFVTLVEQALASVRAWSAETNGPRVASTVAMHNGHQCLGGGIHRRVPGRSRGRLRVLPPPIDHAGCWRRGSCPTR